jgi:hypothetical protein
MDKTILSPHKNKKTPHLPFNVLFEREGSIFGFLDQ